MGIIRRAFISIIRRPGKSLILLFLVFILGNVIAGAVSVQQAVTQTEQTIRQGISAVSTIELDSNKLMNMGQDERDNMEYIPLSVIEQLGTSKYVKYYDYSVPGYLYSDSIKLYTDENNTENMVRVSEEGFNVQGVQYFDMLPFKEGNGQLLEGRTFTEDEVKNGAQVTLITKQLAELNNLRIGDTIVMKNKVYNYENMQPNGEQPEAIASEDIPLTIIGLFEPNQRPDKDDKTGMMAFINEAAVNGMYVPNPVVIAADHFANAELEKVGAKLYPEYYTPYYVLNDAGDTNAFRTEAEALIPDYYAVIDGNSEIADIAGPLLTIKWIAGIVLYVAIIATLLILSLLITLFLRDRKHEIGIYLSLGEKRSKVVLQIIIETVSIALVAITLALFSGNVIAQGISQTMLNNQLIAEQEQVNQGAIVFSINDYGSDLTKQDVVNGYQVSLGINVIIVFYLVGIGTVLVSTLVPVIYIIRMNPKKIML